MKREVFSSFVVKLENDDYQYMFAMDPFYHWKNSEEGSWILAHTKTPPVFYWSEDKELDGFNYSITADLSDEDYIFWELKYK